MAKKELYCTRCKCWVKFNPEFETFRGARKEHDKLCIGDPIANHPDLLDLEAELEFFYGTP